MRKPNHYYGIYDNVFNATSDMMKHWAQYANPTTPRGENVQTGGQGSMALSEDFYRFLRGDMDTDSQNYVHEEHTSVTIDNIPLHNLSIDGTSDNIDTITTTSFDSTEYDSYISIYSNGEVYARIKTDTGELIFNNGKGEMRMSLPTLLEKLFIKETGVLDGDITIEEIE